MQASSGALGTRQTGANSVLFHQKSDGAVERNLRVVGEGKGGRLNAPLQIRRVGDVGQNLGLQGAAVGVDQWHALSLKNAFHAILMLFQSINL